MDPVIQNVIDQIMPFNPEKIILFGSYAYGQPSKDSDVDLVIIKKPPYLFLKDKNKYIYF